MEHPFGALQRAEWVLMMSNRLVILLYNRYCTIIRTVLYGAAAWLRFSFPRGNNRPPLAEQR